ncbi:MAG: fumarylacetoacetate hydrolase family protein [Saprospiraceae bacterium]|jgi:acylpyruvate hydrolase|nr:fumarylacetoacetate hydrolase family protein [Saprospiraceae bacterium]
MKIICVGRNYAEHARELQHAVPDKPMLFMKPATALLINGKPFYYPDFSNDIHYELEVVLKISGNGRHIASQFAPKYYPEITLGIDFTARDLQEECKKKGHPWEIAKAFDHSAVLGDVIPRPENYREGIAFELRKNGEVVQSGNTSDMIFSFDDLIVYSSRFFRLQMSDLIYTGTPAGVGPVQIGDVLEGFMLGQKLLHCEIR